MCSSNNLRLFSLFCMRKHDVTLQRKENPTKQKINNLKLLILEKLRWKLTFCIPLKIGRKMRRKSKACNITYTAFFLLQESVYMNRNHYLPIGLGEKKLLKN